MAKKAKKTASRGATRKAPAAAKKKSVKKAATKKAAPKGKKKGTKKAAPKKKVTKKAAPKKKATKKTAAKKKVAAKAAPVAKPQRKARIKKTRLKAKALQTFRELLLEKRRTLVGDLSGMANETFNANSAGNLSSMPTHMADVGTDNFEHEFTLGLLESEQTMLGEINEALVRVENRTYGVCQGTGEPIPMTRLRAKPWAKYTVEYARLLEKGLVREPDRDVSFSEDAEDEEQ